MQQSPLSPTSPFLKRVSAILSLVALIVGLCILGAGVLFQGRVLSGPDLVNYFIPTTDFARGWLRQGLLPLWNPMTFCGWPLVGDAQLRWMYPPNLLLLVLEPALAFSLLYLAHVAFGTMGMWVYLRKVARTGPWPAACGAASFGLAGFFANHMMSGIVVFPATAAWVPWILLLGWNLGTPGASLRTVAFFAMAIGAQFLSGAPQIVFYTWLVVLFQGVWRAVASGLRARTESASAASIFHSPVRILSYYALGAVLGMGLAATSILPASEFGNLSFQRGDKPSFEAMTDCSVASRYLWLTVAPRFFDNPHVEGTYWGGQDGYWDICGYIGIGPIAAVLFLCAFLPCSLFFTRRQAPPVSKPDGADIRETPALPPSPVAFHLVLAGLALFLARGRFSDVYRLLFEWVPGFDQFRVPGRWLLFWEFGLAAILALVLQRLFAASKEPKQPLLWGLLGPLALVAVLTLNAASGEAAMRRAGIARIAPDFNPSRGRPLHRQWHASTTGSLQRGALFAFGWLVVLAAGTLRNASVRKVAPPIAAALVLVDVLGYGTSIANAPASTRMPRGQTDDFYSRSDLVAFLAPALEDHRELALDDVHYWHVDQNQPELWANRATVHGIRDARGYYPLCLSWFGRFANALHNRSLTHPLGGLLQPIGESSQLDSDVNTDLLAMLDVKYLLSYRALRADGLRSAKRMSFGLWIYEATGRLGPAWLARSRPTEGLSDEREIALLTGPDFDGRREALVPQPPPAGWIAASGDRLGTASLTRASPNRIELRVDREAGDLLVVSEVYHPGWRATIDDERATVVRANHTLLGVFVPPGRHQVEFAFGPTSFRVGLYSAYVASLILAAAVVAGSVRRKRRRS